MFFIDGVFVYQITDNVPVTPGFFLWNNWSNGNAWAKGPPQTTNTVKIQSIVAYYNRTSNPIDMSKSTCRTAASAWTGDTQSCKAIASVGSTYYDFEDTPYNIACRSSLTGVADLTNGQLSSFSACVNACTSLTGCGAVSFDGGDGAGNCYFKNVTGSIATATSTTLDSAVLSVAPQPSASAVVSS